jgi:hypothetical protein
MIVSSTRSVDGLAQAIANLRRRKSRVLLGTWFVALIALQPTIAASQQTVQDQGSSTGQDFFRPPQNLFQLLYGVKTAPGSENTVTTDTLNLRLDHRIDLSSKALLALRSDLPLIAKNPISSSNPEGNYLYGLADADTQAIFIYNFDQRWAAGFGARVIAPTGGDILGSGKWR